VNDRLVTGLCVPDSSWTACIYDVAVGNYDICVADFWVTSERLAMVQVFTPPSP